MQCPTCHGQKNTFGFANKGPDYRSHTQGMMACVTCRGTGEVDQEFPARLAAGESFRRNRMTREESLFDCAQRLNVSTAQLSAYENGRPIDDEAQSKIAGSN